jgi:hypothetical protein
MVADQPLDPRGDRQVVDGQPAPDSRVQFEGDAAAPNGDVRLMPAGPGRVRDPPNELGGRREVVELVGPPEAVAVPVPSMQVPQEAGERLIADAVHGASFTRQRGHPPTIS